jgi:hypothetical protein
MMNKHLAAAVSVVLFGAATSVFAYPFSGSCTSYHAGTVCANTTLPTLQTTNDTKMRGTTVQNSAIIGGKFSVTESSLGSLQTKGDTELSKTTVFGNAKIDGDFRAEKSSIGSLNVSGRTALEDSTVQQSLTSSDLRAASSHLTNVTVSSSKVSLSHTTASNVTVKGSKAVVCLDGSSIGKLSFTQGNGSVYQGSSSTVTNLSGGKVVQGSCPF